MGGMTDAQFKAMLRDELENWKRMKEAAEEEHAEKSMKLAQQQIEIIHDKLNY